MSNSYTTTSTQTFTLTHAKELGSRVIADMRSCNRLYGHPATDSLDDYFNELVELLRNGYLKTYEFGFKSDGNRVLSWFYEVSPCGDLEGGSPGGLFTRGDIVGCSYFNFTKRSTKWWALDDKQRDRFDDTLPFRRSSGQAPTDGDGYWLHNDRGYAAGGQQITRRTFRPH